MNRYPVFHIDGSQLHTLPSETVASDWVLLDSHLLSPIMSPQKTSSAKRYPVTVSTLSIILVIVGIASYYLQWHIPHFSADPSSDSYPEAISHQISKGHHALPDELIANSISRDYPLVKRKYKDTIDTNQYVGDILTFAGAIEKGTNALALIAASPTCVAQSRWTQYADLERYGWRLAIRRQERLDDVGEQSWSLLAPEKGFSTEVEDSQLIHLLHDASSQPDGPPDGKVYPPTNAYYSNLYNRGGLIVAKSNYGPDHEGAKRNPPIASEDIVPLKQWSDVTFLQWQQYCQSLNPDDAQAAADCVRGIRAIARVEIANPTTISIANAALERAGKELEWWGQGETTFDIESDEGKALLATPNGEWRCVRWRYFDHVC